MRIISKVANVEFLVALVFWVVRYGIGWSFVLRPLVGGLARRPGRFKSCFPFHMYYIWGIWLEGVAVR